MTRPFDIAVLGGGAAGLLAAHRAAERGARVVLLEKNRRPGAKILASGGTRCNLTTTRSGHALERSFRGAQGPWLRRALRALPPGRLREWFRDRGVETHAEAWEKVFPDAGRASAVLAALVRAVETAGVTVVAGAPVAAVESAPGGGFLVRTPGSVFAAAKVILATGGRSYPKGGTTGDGYAIARGFGHTVTALHPGLVGLVVPDPRVRALSGIAVEDAAAHLVEGGRRVLGFDRPVLFTHQGVSGPGAMDLGAEVAARGGADLEIDLAGSRSAEALERDLVSGVRSAPNRMLPHVLPGALPERLREFVVVSAGLRPDSRSGDLTKNDRRRLVAILKGVPLRATGTLGWDHAEVTAGGIALDEVDPRSMHSLRVPGLYVCGEVLDVDGPIGGFNFQAAFATGFVAGDAAAGSIRA